MPGSDLKRTEACYASAAAIEKMTNDFSALFAHTSRPSDPQLHNIELNYPTELTNKGYAFPDHTIAQNSAALAAMGTNPTVIICGFHSDRSETTIWPNPSYRPSERPRWPGIVPYVKYFPECRSRHSPFDLLVEAHNMK